MVTLKDKVKKQVKMNGIKTFGISQKDLEKYTHEELYILYDYGFISALMYNTEKMRRVSQ